MPPRRNTGVAAQPRPVDQAFGVKWFSTLGGAIQHATHPVRIDVSRLFGVHIRDTPDRFAFYNNFDHFWSFYSTMTRAQRHAWCEHLNGGPCKLYFDVEWVGPDDKQPTDPVVDAIDLGVRQVIAECKDGGPYNTSFRVLTCHRQQRNGYKYSMHIRYTHIGFKDHADLDRFVHATMAVLERDEVLRRVEHDTNAIVFIVDKTVYKRSQSLRCPMATKWSTDPEFPVGALGFDRLDDAQHLVDPADFFVQALGIKVSLVTVDSLPPLPSTLGASKSKRQVTIDSMFGTHAASRQRVHDLPPLVDVTQHETNSVRELLVVNGVPVPRASDLEWQRTAIVADEFMSPVELPGGQTCIVCKRVHDRSHHLWVVYVRRTASVIITCPQSPDRRAVFYLVPEIGTWFDDESVPWNEVHAADVDTIVPYRFPPPKTTLLVQAQYGMGKTRALGELLSTLPRSARVIFVTNRIKLAQKYAADFALYGILNYEDNPDPMQRVANGAGWGFRVATCYNSLQKFSMPYGNRYDLVVLDEISSVLPDTNSRFVANRDSLLFTFGNLVRNADRVIGLDADVSYLAYTFILQLRGLPSLHTVCYEYRRPTDRVIYECSSHFDDLILSDIASGKRIVVASMTKSYADEIYARIDARFGGNIEIAFGKITSACPNGTATRASGFKANDPTTWGALNCLVYSPSIGAGVSCELDHFDRLYLYAWVSPGTPTCYDVLQMVHRVRSLREGSIFVFFAHLPDTNDQFDMSAYPTSAAEVIKMFERRDTKVFDGLLGRPEPITRQRVASGDIILPEYTMEFWPTALYINSLLRAVRSVTHFKPLFYSALLDQRYRREEFTPSITEAERIERERGTDLTMRLARVDAVAQAHPALPRDAIEHFSKFPDALRHAIDFWDWKESPNSVYDRLIGRASIDAASESPSLARRDNVLDQRATHWLYFLRFADVVLHLRTNETAVDRDGWAILVANTMRYMQENPRGSVRSIISHGTNPDPTSRSAEIYLKATIRDFGINICSTKPSRTASRGSLVYQASTVSFDILQAYAQSHPSDFHQFVYDLCKESIEARRTAEQSTLTEAALGEMWLFK